MTFEHDYKLVGIGIGAPNISYDLGAIVDAPNLQWKGILPVCKEITKHTGVNSVVTNDANAAAVGETFGDAQGMKNFVILTLGTGLGSGIVVDGRLVLGSEGFAGEFGHIVAQTQRKAVRLRKTWLPRNLRFCNRNSPNRI